jgi:hypothetical protein
MTEPLRLLPNWTSTPGGVVAAAWRASRIVRPCDQRMVVNDFSLPLL